MLVAAGKADASDVRVAKALAGGTVNLLVPAEGAQLGVQDKMAEIKKKLGIDVKMTALAVGPLNEKLAQSVKLSKGNYDVISVLGFTVAAFVGRRLLHAAQLARQEAAGELRVPEATSPPASSSTSATSTRRRRRSAGRRCT